MADARIFTDLTADHDRQRALIARVGVAGTDQGRREAFETLRLELQAHAAAEEESLYATMLANPDLREGARHSVSEHKEVDDLLGALLDLDFGSADWDAKFGEMRHRLPAPYRRGGVRHVPRRGRGAERRRGSAARRPCSSAASRASSSAPKSIPLAMRASDDRRGEWPDAPRCGGGLHALRPLSPRDPDGVRRRPA